MIVVKPSRPEHSERVSRVFSVLRSLLDAPGGFEPVAASTGESKHLAKKVGGSTHTLRLIPGIPSPLRSSAAGSGLVHMIGRRIVGRIHNLEAPSASWIHKDALDALPTLADEWCDLLRRSDAVAPDEHDPTSLFGHADLDRATRIAVAAALSSCGGDVPPDTYVSGFLPSQGRRASCSVYIWSDAVAQGDVPTDQALGVAIAGRLDALAPQSCSVEWNDDAGMVVIGGTHYWANDVSEMDPIEIMRIIAEHPGIDGLPSFSPSTTRRN